MKEVVIITIYEIVKETKKLENNSIIIKFKCPKCKQDITAPWRFPNTLLIFTTDCCDELVVFKPI